MRASVFRFGYTECQRITPVSDRIVRFLGHPKSDVKSPIGPIRAETAKKVTKPSHCAGPKSLAESTQNQALVTDSDLVTFFSGFLK